MDKSFLINIAIFQFKQVNIDFMVTLLVVMWKSLTFFLFIEGMH